MPSPNTYPKAWLGLPLLLLLFWGLAPKPAPKKKLLPPELVPPGCIQLAPNFFCDETEMVNLHWREYEYWTGRVYGKDSPEYEGLLLDTAVWKGYACLSDYVEYYLRHPAYNNYPLVGVSQQQAEGYARWRSDRVFENWLLRQGRVTLFTDPTRDTHFTVERYYNGTYLHTVPGQPLAEYYPHYSLPTLQERSTLLQYADSVDGAYFAKCHGKRCNECRQEYPRLRCAVVPCQDPSIAVDGTADPMVDVYKACVAQKGQPLYQLRGNAAEWVAEPDIAVGGGWPHDKARIMAQDTFHVNTPNAWTGFRNVCRWKKWTGVR